MAGRLDEFPVSALHRDNARSLQLVISASLHPNIATSQHRNISTSRHLDIATCLGRLLLLLALCVALPAPASAQQADAQPGDDARFRMGVLRFTPYLVVSDIGIDSNVFNEETDPKRDTTAALGPGVSYWSRAGRAQVSGKATGQYLYYREYENQRAWNSNVEAQIDMPMNRVVPFVGGSYSNSRVRPGFEIDARARRRTTHGRLGSRIRLGGKSSLVVTGSREILAYDENQTFFGIDLAQVLDRRTDTEQLQFRYALTPLTTLVVNGEGIQDRFDTEASRNADSVRVLAGFELKPFALISGKASVGFRRFDVLDSATPDFNGIIAAVDARYVLRATQFATRVNRDITYSYEVTTPYYALTDLNLQVTQRVTTSWDLLARTGTQWLGYRRVATGAALPDRVDRGYVYGGGIRYRVGDTGSIGVDVNYSERNSSSAVRSFNGLRVGASVSYGSPQ